MHGPMLYAGMQLQFLPADFYRPGRVSRVRVVSVRLKSSVRARVRPEGRT